MTGTGQAKTQDGANMNLPHLSSNGVRKESNNLGLECIGLNNAVLPDLCLDETGHMYCAGYIADFLPSGDDESSEFRCDSCFV